MKRLFIPFLLIIALLFACRNGENKNATSSNEATVNTKKIEEESADLEKTTDEIESKSAALEEALKDLD